MSLSESQARAAVAAHMPGVRADLENLIRIPGIAFDGFDFSHLDRSAEAVAKLLRGVGLPEVRIVSGGGRPAVVGRRPAPDGAPTVLLYAHHDVQPVGDPAQWHTDPFDPVERGGRLYGRGAADDKAGIMTHVAALRAFGDDLPVGVVVFVEGEEEFGSTTLGTLLKKHRNALAADVIVIADSGNWDIGEPALTTSLRGIINTFVEVRTLRSAVHSGMFGGAVPDALTTLCRLLATLHDDAGDVAIPGLVRREAAELEYPLARFRAEAGLLDGVELIGTGRIVDRLWMRPAVSVLGIDAPKTSEAPNALIASATAKVSMRIAPGDNPKSAFLALQEHLDRHTPWGARVTLTLESDGEPCVLDSSGPAYRAAEDAFATAWNGQVPVEIGVGGSIPFIATFQELFPQAEILVIGVEDPNTAAHGPNESLHLAEFERGCVAETLFLSKLASLRPRRRPQKGRPAAATTAVEAAAGAKARTGARAAAGAGANTAAAAKAGAMGKSEVVAKSVTGAKSGAVPKTAGRTAAAKAGAVAQTATAARAGTGARAGAGTAAKAATAAKAVTRAKAATSAKAGTRAKAVTPAKAGTGTGAKAGGAAGAETPRSRRKPTTR